MRSGKERGTLQLACRQIICQPPTGPQTHGTCGIHTHAMQNTHTHTSHQPPTHAAQLSVWQWGSWWRTYLPPSSPHLFQLHPSHPTHTFLSLSLTFCPLSSVVSLLYHNLSLSSCGSIMVCPSLGFCSISPIYLLLFVFAWTPWDGCKKRRRKSHQWKMDTVENTHWSVI